jgi:hypothetical protein
LRIRRAIMAFKKTVCQYGHSFLIEENLAYRKDGRRICKPCKADRDKAFYLKHRDRLRARKRAYYQANKARYKAYAAARYPQIKRARAEAIGQRWGSFWKIRRDAAGSVAAGL